MSYLIFETEIEMAIRDKIHLPTSSDYYLDDVQMSLSEKIARVWNYQRNRGINMRAHFSLYKTILFDGTEESNVYIS